MVQALEVKAAHLHSRRPVVVRGTEYAMLQERSASSEWREGETWMAGLGLIWVCGLIWRAGRPGERHDAAGGAGHDAQVHDVAPARARQAR